MRHRFLPNEGRARLAIIGCGLHAAINAAHGVLIAMLALQYGEIEDTAPYETAENAIVIALLGGLVVAAVSFLFWFRRAYGNAQALGLRGAHSPGWAVGAWFVPILNLFRPAQIAFEMWRHAGKDLTGPTSIVGLWWTGFLVYNFGRRIGDAMLQARDDDMHRTALKVMLLADFAGVVGLCLAIVMIRRLGKAHEAMQIRLSAATFA